jgi:hypothetical protein
MKNIDYGSIKLNLKGIACKIFDEYIKNMA